MSRVHKLNDNYGSYHMMFDLANELETELETALEDSSKQSVAYELRIKELEAENATLKATLAAIHNYERTPDEDVTSANQDRWGKI